MAFGPVACSDGISSSSFARPARVNVKPPDGNARSAAIVNSVRSDIVCGPTIGGAGGGAGGGGGVAAHAHSISPETNMVAVAMTRLLIMG